MNNYTIVVPQQSQDYTRISGPLVLTCNSGPAAVEQHGMIEPPMDVYQQFLATNFSYTKLSLDCDCSSGFPVCPASAGGDYNYRDVYVLKTTDILYDLTSRNMTDYLVKTEFNDQFFKKRFGGFEFVPPIVAVDNNFAANFFGKLNG